MSKIIIGRLISYLVTLLIGFFVARHQLSEDVARKLYAGDTIELWGGAWSINLKQVVDFLTISIVPALIPIGLAIWGRITERYKLIVARLSPKPLTNFEVKEKVADTPVTTIIQTVAAKSA